MVTFRVAVRGIEFEDEYDEDDDEGLEGEEAYVVTGMEDIDERREDIEAVEKKDQELEEFHEPEPENIRLNIKQNNGYDEISALTLFTDSEAIFSADDNEIEVSLAQITPELNPSYDDDAGERINVPDSDSESYELENSRAGKNRRRDIEI